MVVIFFLSLALSFFFPVKIIFFYLYFAGAIWGISYLWTRSNRERLSIFRQLACQELFFGEEFEAELVIENRSPFPLPWLYIYDLIPVRLYQRSTFRDLIHLPGKSSARLPYRLVASRRGYYSLGPWEARSTDLFGIYPWRLTQAAPQYVTVYPKIVPLRELSIASRQPFGTVRTNIRVFEDPSRRAGLREYRIGDSYNKINWKVTARTGKLHVNLYLPSISLGTMIFLNLASLDYQRPYDDDLERAIVVAASVASHITGLRQEVGLTCNGGIDSPKAGKRSEGISISLNKGDSHLRQILMVLARLEAVDEPGFIEFLTGRWLESQSFRLPWGTALIFISSGPSDMLFLRLLELCRAGYNITLFLVQISSDQLHQLRGRWQSKGIKIYRVREEEDLQALE